MPPTEAQWRVIHNLEQEYGPPDRLLISHGWDHIIRMDWLDQRRSLFIDQDGVRVVWSLIDS